MKTYMITIYDAKDRIIEVQYRDYFSPKSAEAKAGDLCVLFGGKYWEVEEL